MDYQKNARVFKALCDENRWKILDLLKNGEQCGCVLLNKLDISQSTLSHHMKDVYKRQVYRRTAEG